MRSRNLIKSLYVCIYIIYYNRVESTQNSNGPWIRIREVELISEVDLFGGRLIKLLLLTSDSFFKFSKQLVYTHIVAIEQYMIE